VLLVSGDKGTLLGGKITYDFRERPVFLKCPNFV